MKHLVVGRSGPASAEYSLIRFSKVSQENVGNTNKQQCCTLEAAGVNAKNAPLLR